MATSARETFRLIQRIGRDLPLDVTEDEQQLRLTYKMFAPEIDPDRIQWGEVAYAVKTLWENRHAMA